MRVIAGKLRSLPLKTVPGNDTRPTTDRIKETLFNMLQGALEDVVFLDVFSGSGGIGIEALSRGAQKCYFIEKDRKAADVIAGNIAFTKMQEYSTIMKEDFLTAFRKLEGREVFDFVFADPPYGQELEKQMFSYLQNSSLIHEDTVLIVEAALGTDFSYLPEYGFELEKIKKYKTNEHVFVQKA